VAVPATPRVCPSELARGDMAGGTKVERLVHRTTRTGTAMRRSGRIEAPARSGTDGAGRSVAPAPKTAQNASVFRIAAATRSADGMYASSICQYGYGTS
jgi:hypothetical protein